MPSSGAISFYTYNSGNFLEDSGTTFKSNEGGLGGGAIAVYEDSINVHAKVENSTFYKNNFGEGIRNASGAISTHIYDDDQYGELDGVNFASWNNTFLDNSVVKKAVTEIKGGAIGFENNIFENSLIKNLFVGNKLENGERNQKLFDNIFVYSKNIENIRNLGFDNGVQTKHTVASVYGKYTIKLESNDSTIKAGRKEDAKIIPTLRIAPNLKNFNGKQYVGIANMSATFAPKTDQQGNKRLGSPDLDAVEISSLVYDTNLGNFTLSEMKSYDGKKYYEGKNPKQYAEVGIPGKKYSILDHKKILKPIRKNYIFLGWSDDEDASKANSKYNTGKPKVVEDQEILYEVWQEKKSTLKYFSNGKTTGLIPTQMTAPSSTKLMIQSAAKMKRKGYKFKGWSTNLTQSKQILNLRQVRN